MYSKPTKKIATLPKNGKKINKLFPKKSYPLKWRYKYRPKAYVSIVNHNNQISTRNDILNFSLILLIDKKGMSLSRKIKLYIEKEKKSGFSLDNYSNKDFDHYSINFKGKRENLVVVQSLIRNFNLIHSRSQIPVSLGSLIEEIVTV